MNKEQTTEILRNNWSQATRSYRQGDYVYVRLTHDFAKNFGIFEAHARISNTQEKTLQNLVDAIAKEQQQNARLATNQAMLSGNTPQLET